MAHHDEDNRLLLKRLLAVGRECEWLEFKQGSAEPNRIGEYLSSLSNSSLLHSQSHGYLIFGVRDTSLDVVGTDFSFRQKKVGDEETH